jgi:hypothetical protein
MGTFLAPSQCTLVTKETVKSNILVKGASRLYPWAL